MAKKSFLRQLTGQSPSFKIIDFLLENKGLDYTKKEIEKGAGIARASIVNYWPELEKDNIVKVTRAFGKTKLYMLNSASPMTKKIIELESALIRQGMDKVQTKQVVTH